MEKDKKLEIDKDIINKTIHCENNFECLTNSEHHCRKSTVGSCIGKNVIFINCSTTTCNYKMSYGNVTVCNCPTRKAIYLKYGF